MHIPMQENYPIAGVSAVIFDTKGRVLLVLRGNEPLKDMWSFPGGKIHFGETRQAACQREVLEETGLRIAIQKLITSVEFIDIPTASHFLVFSYLGSVVSGEPKASSDAAQVAWVTPHETQRLYRANKTTPQLWQVYCHALKDHQAIT